LRLLNAFVSAEHVACSSSSGRWFERSEVATALVEGFKRPEGLIVPPPYAIAHQLMKAWLQMSSNL